MKYRMQQGGAFISVFMLIGLVASASAEPPSKAAPSCAQPLWGCPPRGTETDASGPAALRYERLVAAARTAAGPLRIAMAGELDTAARYLTEAIALVPDSPEAHSLLGQVHLERGQLEAAAPALRRAEELLAPSGAIERTDSQLALALGLTAALEGDLTGGLERYLRLMRLGAASHRLLYRTGDVLMALGRLEEATALFERACMLSRAHDVPAVDVPRACLGYLVALDRGEHIRAAQTLRRVRLLDRDLKTLRYNDFLTPWEREYHVALSQPAGSCDRLQALSRYLRGAKGVTAASAQASAQASGQAPQSPAAATSAPKSDAPLSYIRRAEVHVKELGALSCPTS